MTLNIADLFEHAVDAVPERTALVVGETRMTYRELDAAANRVAHHLVASGVRPGDHVGLMARNTPEHVAAMLGTFKARSVPINVNYRYVEGELDYLIDNSQMVALLHEARYAELLDGVVPRHERLRHVVDIAHGIGDQPADRSFTAAVGDRSPDDVYIVYTGGTTGYPKGVMWRHEDVWRTLGGGIDFATGERLGEYDQSTRGATNPDPLTCLQLGPIMHANGQWGMLLRFLTCHTNVLLPKFDPAEIWRTVEAERVQTISLIGDAMARPLIEEFESGRYDGSTLVNLNSAAAIFSVEVKQRWLDALPGVVVMDIIGSSETGFTGNGRVEPSNLADKGSLVDIGVDMAVLDEDMRPMDSSAVGAIGLMARSGNIPLGYFCDPDKTARTFPTIDGIRYAVPGDWVQIEPDRKVTLLGRGSSCINTGGEKVYPEEVEVALKSHPAVFDTLVIGMPDPTYGQQVSALVQARPGADIDFDEIRAHLRTRISGYKVPRSMRVVEEIPRHVTGKADYRAAREMAEG